MDKFKSATKTAPTITALKKKYGIKKADAIAVIKEINTTTWFLNSKYEVGIRCQGDHWHLTVKRIDREPIHDWRDLQHIKNELIGPENEGVEIYPAESRLLDTSNQYHLWVAKSTAFRFRFGFFPEGQTVLNKEEAEALGAKQRPVGTT